MLQRRILASAEIGDKIKKKRKELDISQEKLADMLGVTYQQVQRYENGTNKLNVENIQVVADILSVPVSYFFEIEDMPMMVKDAPFALPGQEVKLLRHFRNIRSDQFKAFVIQAARVAEKAGLETTS